MIFKKKHLKGARAVARRIMDTYAKTQKNAIN